MLLQLESALELRMREHPLPLVQQKITQFCGLLISEGPEKWENTRIKAHISLQRMCVGLKSASTRWNDVSVLKFGATSGDVGLNIELMRRLPKAILFTEDTSRIGRLWKAPERVLSMVARRGI